MIPNCVTRGTTDGPKSQKIYVADQLDGCKDFAEMTFSEAREEEMSGELGRGDGYLETNILQ